MFCTKEDSFFNSSSPWRRKKLPRAHEKKTRGSARTSQLTPSDEDLRELHLQRDLRPILKLEKNSDTFFILYYTILYYTILYYTILYYTILYYTILYYTILYYTILYYTILYYTILYYTMLYYTMLCYAMLCYAMLCYAMLCYAMLCYAMLCYAMLYYTYTTIIFYDILRCFGILKNIESTKMDLRKT